MNYKTITGKRPDLEQLETNPVIGYIGNRLYPTLGSAEKLGYNYYKTLTADSAAQSGLASGTAPTRVAITDSSTTFSCTRVIKGYTVAKDEVKQMGGIEKADRAGGMGSKRSVQRAIETLHIAQLFTGSPIDISSGIIAGIQTGAESVRRYPGKLAFVCSVSVYTWITSQTAITDKLLRTFQGLQAEEVLSMKAKAFLAMLQMIMGFDEVLIFDDDFEPSGKGDYAAVCKLPDPAEESHKLDPVLGKTNLYLPDGVQQFEIESFYNEDTKVNCYDCESWLNIKEFNAAAKYLVDGLDTAS